MRSRNVGVVIRDRIEGAGYSNTSGGDRGRDKEVVPETENGLNRKRKATYLEKGKAKVGEASSYAAANSNSTSRRSLAQQARRARESAERIRTQPNTARTTSRQQDVPVSIATIAQRARRATETACTYTPNVNGEFDNIRRNLSDEFAALGNNNRPITDPTLLEGSNSDNDSEDVCLREESNIPINPSQGRHFLGNMDVKCGYCGALHWMDEKLTSSSKLRPIFGTCCSQGKVRLPLLNTPPPTLQALYDGTCDMSHSFRRYTREYNACNAFTSLGAKVDDRVLNGRGPNSFIIHGELHHRTGPLLHDGINLPSYAQLYIYDPDSALEIRNRRNPHLRQDVIKSIQDTMLEHNPFPSKYREAYDLLTHSQLEDENLPAYLHYNSSTDRRRYNMPTADEIAVILPGDGSEISGMRDIRLHLRGGNQFMQINECHPAYLPLHYVLLFPRGELGWEPEMKLWDVTNNCTSSSRLTQMQYYRYRIFQRDSEYSTILRGGKLFQEFLVDAWAATEQNRLTFFKLNQDKIRSELYTSLTDSIGLDGLGAEQIGQPMVLPSSHIGSPRHMFEIFQDSMAITRYNHHPDIFLTMTANPKWPEIKSALLPHQKPTDRPDLVARVFDLKKKALMEVIDKKKIFGQKVAHVYTIEFQKRGLPHMHLLIFLAGPDKIRTCAQVDKYVSAEFPDPKVDPLLFETIRSCMIHGPCGTRNPQAPCMENGKCTKRYPKEFVESTTMDKDGYPIYKRTNTGIVYEVKGHEVDNRDVVPYNPFLSRMFNCHINVEVCAGLRCVKYIHKYIYKGHDRTTMILGGVDEIQQYLDSRYIGPPEAAWRILGNSLHEEIPSVTRLALHLPGMHRVNFNPNEPLSVILARAATQVSTLTGFFEYYALNPEAPKYTYQEFPQYFVWKGNSWSPRQKGFAIGRMYFASPNCGERFYLRLLLTHVKGPNSFENLRTVNNITHPTFKSACVAMGLVEDDEEWIQCLEEASIMKTGHQLRRLFGIILTECSPIYPLELWKRFSINICDDLYHKIHTLFGITDPSISQIEDYGLHLLDQILQESGKSLSDFPPMPEPSGMWNVITGNRLLWEHQQLHVRAQQYDVESRVANLNRAQRRAYFIIMASVLESKGMSFFLNGGAGTGKTFLYNTLSMKCRSMRQTVVTVASSGIASLLLVGGRTAHSTFRIPLDIQENSVCGFTKQSIHAELFRDTKMIIWDEVPMQHRHCVEAVDRTLRDLRDCDKPFGGITIVLGGDFRQILPVVPKGVREQIVGVSLRRSRIWLGIQVLTLDVNMRLNSSNIADVEFTNFLNEIGSSAQEIIQIPPAIHKCRHLNELIDKIYPQLNLSATTTPEFLTERTILSARNDDVTFINQTALSIFPGETKTYLAADKMSEDCESDSIIANRYPSEYLNSLDPPDLPPFKLDLKVGCPIMLLRNLAPNEGLCNGTRLMVVRCGARVLEARILTGDKAGNLVFIPRISLTPSSGEFPFQLTRRQFPVRLAYAMTINKSQGQSVKFVGVDLRNPIFSHGQLYVALSRCTSSDRISILLPTNDTSSTTNIVYPEVLL